MVVVWETVRVSLLASFFFSMVVGGYHRRTAVARAVGSCRECPGWTLGTARAHRWIHTAAKHHSIVHGQGTKDGYACGAPHGSISRVIDQVSLRGGVV